MKSLAVIIFFLALATLSAGEGETCPCYRRLKPTCASVVYKGEGTCARQERENCQYAICDYFGNEECELVETSHYKFNGTANYCQLTDPIVVAKCPSGTPPPPPVIPATNRTFCCEFSGKGSMSDFMKCSLPSWTSLPEAKHPFANLTRIFRTLNAKSDLTFITQNNGTGFTVFTYTYSGVFNFTFNADPELPPLFDFYQTPPKSDFTLIQPNQPLTTFTRGYDQMYDFTPLYPGDSMFEAMVTWPKNKTEYEMLFYSRITSGAQRVATYDALSCITYEFGSNPAGRP